MEPATTACKPRLPIGPDILRQIKALWLPSANHIMLWAVYVRARATQIWVVRSWDEALLSPMPQTFWGGGSKGTLTQKVFELRMIQSLYAGIPRHC